ncbi:MAG: acyl-CoA dehydratase activase [Candidatus Krumholzibacteria bacterium]|jgi:predicted CoA-substrate-specific enzyme activase|nr:acyl-CoA dehydratase activase [Candidatus Krumholzibacteria bacterium]MDP6668439.1 acyl-CoA dehydratase activase [Candidatus Krumholzibacteria bacterium]MDP6797260.1 acyl-CoA dehydratase activase [Candidatus Krumholzibacteria bacterium]MDP7021837.1 acyl-CoA dehydratase activase [Candidatus Krumholzibacteria bacterium]
MSDVLKAVAGLDVGTECVKSVILGEDRQVLGRAVVQTRGYFQERIREVFDLALDDAGLQEEDLSRVCATGFGANLVPSAEIYSSESTCHARAASRYFPGEMTVVNIGGHEPRVIKVNEESRAVEISALRQCGVGIGTFLMYAARHLDVHPTQLQELASSADLHAHVGSYCSVFAGAELLERLREGASREEVALGSIHSVAERVAEMSSFDTRIRVSGGVAEYFPGVMKSLSLITGQEVEGVPEPIMAGALGAALKAWEGEL